jgi:hypothetical protein
VIAGLECAKTLETTMGLLRPGDMFWGWSVFDEGGHDVMLCLSNVPLDPRFPEGDRAIASLSKHRVQTLRYGQTASVIVFKEQPAR